MANLYELDIQVQIRRLRNTAIFFLIGGGSIGYALCARDHWVGALFVIVIAIQAASGSAIIMTDLRSDLDQLKKTETSK